MKPMFFITALAILVFVGPTNAKGYHYHAPKITTYHAPRQYQY